MKPTSGGAQERSEQKEDFQAKLHCLLSSGSQHHFRVIAPLVQSEPLPPSQGQTSSSLTAASAPLTSSLQRLRSSLLHNFNLITPVLLPAFLDTSPLYAVLTGATKVLPTRFINFPTPMSLVTEFPLPVLCDLFLRPGKTRHSASFCSTVLNPLKSSATLLS